MTSKFSLTLYLVIISYLIASGQNSSVGLTIVSEEITEIVTSEKKIITRTKQPAKKLNLRAAIWPNPSNLGKVRLSVENLPEEPVFIQIFNDKLELIQEGVINGTKGSSLHHTLSLPDASGTYSIKLSDANRIIKDLELEIL